MATDNWPVEFRYISRRLVREKVQQHEAGEGELDASVGVEYEGIKFQTQRQPPDYSNERELARRTTAAVRRLTGTLNEPQKTYLRTTLTFLPKTCNVALGWDNDELAGWPIAGFFADEDVAGRRVFVALFGSISNLHGWQKQTRVGHYTPSDAAGLYAILNCVFEEEDPGISTDPVYQHRERLQSSPIERLGAARLMRIATGTAFLEEPLEVLAQVFVFERGVNIRRPSRDALLTPPEYTSRPAVMGGDRYDLAVIGAPVWVATPRSAAASEYRAAKARDPDAPALSDGSSSAPVRRRRILDRLRRSSWMVGAGTSIAFPSHRAPLRPAALVEEVALPLPLPLPAPAKPTGSNAPDGRP